jgi:general secretion pathway protein A
MYLSHYRLEQKPFGISPDPTFFWLSESHKEGWAALEYGIRENKGFLILTGDIGTGKTALINLIIRSTQVNSVIATIPDPDLDILDFFNILAEEFQMNKIFDSKGKFLIEFKNFLYEVYGSEGKVLLIIDEAQRLNFELLGQIRALSNIERADHKLINIFFVGQPEFIDILREKRNEAVRKRITVSYHLEPLSVAETGQYIKHRLSVAGVTREIFTSEAVYEIHAFTGGYPRLINILCDHALLSGYSADLNTINTEIIKECENDLYILSDEQQPRQNSRMPDPIEETSYYQENDYNKINDTHKTIEIVKTPAKKQDIKGKVIFAGLILLAALTGYFISHFQSSNTSPLSNLEHIQSRGDQNLKAETLQPENNSKQPLSKTKAIQTVQTDKLSPNTEISEQAAGESLSQVDEYNQQVGENSQQANKSSEQGDRLRPPKKPASLDDQKYVIHFKHKSDRIPRRAHQTLDQIIKLSAYNPESQIVVEGYTDSMGNYYYNKNLSKIRADTVKEYLISKGIPPSKISTIGKGSENPIQSNATREGRNKNRRVEIKVKANPID